MLMRWTIERLLITGLILKFCNELGNTSFTVDDLYDLRVKEEGSHRISRSTIDKTLDLLAGEGYLDRKDEGGRKLYSLKVSPDKIKKDIQNYLGPTRLPTI